METVRELRALSACPRSKTALEKAMTEKGIFSLHFASESCLQNIVSDTTIDTMHIFLCGISRYLLSWLTDELIPNAFSWESLNKENKAHTYAIAHHPLANRGDVALESLSP